MIDYRPHLQPLYLICHILVICQWPANTRHPPNVGPMLGHRRRRWTVIGPALGKCLVSAGIWMTSGHPAWPVCWPAEYSTIPRPELHRPGNSVNIQCWAWSSQLSNVTQKVLLVRFSLYGHKGWLKTSFISFLLEGVVFSCSVISGMWLVDMGQIRKYNTNCRPT